MTRVCRDAVDARRPVLARVVRAVVDVVPAPVAVEAERARARVHVPDVDARRAVVAAVRRADVVADAARLDVGDLARVEPSCRRRVADRRLAEHRQDDPTDAHLRQAPREVRRRREHVRVVTPVGGGGAAGRDVPQQDVEGERRRVDAPRHHPVHRQHDAAGDGRPDHHAVRLAVVHPAGCLHAPLRRVQVVRDDDRARPQLHRQVEVGVGAAQVDDRRARRTGTEAEGERRQQGGLQVVGRSVQDVTGAPVVRARRRACKVRSEWYQVYRTSPAIGFVMIF